MFLATLARARGHQVFVRVLASLKHHVLGSLNSIRKAKVSLSVLNSDNSTNPRLPNIPNETQCIGCRVSLHSHIELRLQ